MAIADFIADLRRRGVELRVEGNGIDSSRKGVLTENDLATLRARKAEIIATLRASPPPDLQHPKPRPTKAGDVQQSQKVGREQSDPSDVDASEVARKPDSRVTSQKSQKSQKSSVVDPPGISAISAISAKDLAGRETAPHQPETFPVDRDETLRVRPSDQDKPRRKLGPVAQVSSSVPAPLADCGNPVVSIVSPLTVTISGRVFSYRFWDGQVLGGDDLGFDTETALIIEDEVPPLALATVSSGSEHFVIHPDRIGAFILLHRDRHFIFHNVGFDFWVIDEHLTARGETEALEAWWAIADEGRMHDSMILDELIRLARTDAYPPRNLGEVALEYADMEIDKQDPFRLRYGEIIGRDWDGVERGFFDYAIKDPIVTLAAYRRMREDAIQLMEAHGYDCHRYA